MDRGTRAQIFARRVALSRILESEGYFLFNGKLEGEIETVKEGWADPPFAIVPIALRGLEIPAHESSSLVLHHFHGALAPSTRLFLSRIPALVPIGFEKREFPREQTGTLFRAGCEWGWKHAQWPRWGAGQSLPDADPPIGARTPPDACVADATPPPELCESGTD